MKDISVMSMEFVGTFLLVLTVYLTVAQEKVFAGLAIGTVLAVMVYMGADVSGSHFNPAVSLGIFMVRRPGEGNMRFKQLVMYVVAQLLGGICGAAIGYFLVPADVWSPTWGKRGLGPAFACELLFTFALVLVVLNIACCKATATSNHFFGLAIGMTVFAGATACGPFSGAVFNPAVGTGLCLVHFIAGGKVVFPYLYWVAPLLGGGVAAVVFQMTNPAEFVEEKKVKDGK